MSFSAPLWLWALWALPVLALLEWWSARRVARRLRALVGDRRHHPLLADRARRERLTGALLRIAAFAALVAGAAGPEWGREVVRRGSTGSDVALLIDVSASMDSRDVPPSRIDEARREAMAVLDRLTGSRVAVVAFAGDAVRLCPLTLDVPAARLTVEAMSTGALSAPGTDVAKGLRAALRVMPPGRREEQAIVLWTDGEDLEQGARAAIDDVTRTGIRVFAVGVGTREGDVVPVLDADGHMTDVKRDERGSPVRSRLDEDLLRMLAQKTHGAYFAANRPGGELGRLLGAIDNLARTGRRQRLVERPVPRFPLFAGIAALLLAIDFARRKRRRDPGDTAVALRSGRDAAAAAALLACALLAAPGPARAQSAWERGNRAFAKGRWAAADSLYDLRLRRGGPDAVRVNRSTARALAGRTVDGERELDRLGSGAGPAAGAARYNLGTLEAERHADEDALAALRRTLIANPNDADARWNYEVVLRRIQQQQQQRQQRPQQPKPDQGGGGQQPQPSQPQPQPQAPQPSPSQPQQAPPRPSSAQQQGMTREQADRLLNALGELARSEQQKRQPVRAVQEKRGRDW